MAKKKIDRDIKHLLEPHELEEFLEEEEEELDVSERVGHQRDKAAISAARARRAIEEHQDRKRYQDLLDDSFDEFDED